MTTADWQFGILAWGWLAMVLFVVCYPLFAKPWWRSQFGRSLEASEVSMAVLVGLSLASYWFKFLVPDPVATVIFFSISAVAWMRFIALLSEQLAKRKSDDE